MTGVVSINHYDTVARLTTICLICLLSFQDCAFNKLQSNSALRVSFQGNMRVDGHCCGATAGSEQQHNQDLREIYKGQRILEFITFYHNALHLTTLFTTMHCI